MRARFEASTESLFKHLSPPCFRSTEIEFMVFEQYLQRYMDSEIRAIMAQYMPLDNQGDIPVHHASRGDI